MSWLIHYFCPDVSDLQRDIAALRMIADSNTITLTLIKKELKTMAADRELLAQLADSLTQLATPVAALIASEKALRARVAELEGAAAADEAGDLEAATAVKTAFDALAGQFVAEEEAPDVEPLPEG